MQASEIGKLVVVSSTGFLGPGLDCSLIKTLGLEKKCGPFVNRLHGLRGGHERV